MLHAVNRAGPELVVRVGEQRDALLHPGVEGVRLALLAECIVVVLADEDEGLRRVQISD